MQLLLVVLAVGVVSAGVAVGVSLGIRSAVTSQRREAGQERDAAVQAALQQAALLQREQLSAQIAAGQSDLSAKKDVIDARLDQVRNEMRGELHRLGELVGDLGRRSSEQFGRVEQSLRTQAEVTQTLSVSAQSLREALASPKARGQWGERMAEDVLRIAGFQEHINYVKQTAMEGARSLPDFTFFMPKQHVLYMDVKFPLSAYLRYLEADNDVERSLHRETFIRDVRLRVKELAQREYARAGDRPAVDYVLLFLPNESIAGFIHEQDPDLVEHALRQRVVLCSPLTLFAMLGVIRQAFDQFMMEQTSNEMLQLLSKFTQQWAKYGESLDKVQSRFEALAKDFEHLVTTRRRQLERPLLQLDALRNQRGVALDGELLDGDLLDGDLLDGGLLEMIPYEELGPDRSGAGGPVWNP